VAHELQHGAFLISDEAARIDARAAHAYLSRSYWAEHIPFETVERSIRHSMPFGVYEPSGAMIGFARVISDRATFAYIGDVYILEPFRGRGLSKALMRCILSHPDLQGLRRWMLMTRDAHGLYSQFGFKNPAKPQNVMEIRCSNTYAAPVDRPV
jgi:N-acetylglutamate synthase-like GNAT family acetyltransferase